MGKAGSIPVSQTSHDSGLPLQRRAPCCGPCLRCRYDLAKTRAELEEWIRLEFVMSRLRGVRVLGSLCVVSQGYKPDNESVSYLHSNIDLWLVYWSRYYERLRLSGHRVCCEWRAWIEGTAVRYWQLIRYWLDLVGRARGEATAVSWLILTL
jgi:hypothetical protein